MCIPYTFGWDNVVDVKISVIGVLCVIGQCPLHKFTLLFLRDEGGENDETCLNTLIIT